MEEEGRGEDSTHLVDYTIHLRPAFKFANPMGKRGQRTHDQERPVDILITVKILQEGDAL